MWDRLMAYLIGFALVMFLIGISLGYYTRVCPS